MLRIPVEILSTAIAGFSLLPAQAAETSSPPSISVDADGKVMATPDLARLTLEVETQAATAAAAGQENAKQASAVLAAVKPVLGPEDKLRTLGYRLIPVHSYRDKSSPSEIKGYRAVNQVEVKVTEVARLGTVIDTALKSGATRVNGPYYSHSRLEELQRQAAVNALERARRLAEALAQAAGLKIKAVMEEKETGNETFPRPHLFQLCHYSGPLRGKRYRMLETEIIPEMLLPGIGLERTLIGEIFGEKNAGQGPNRINTASVMFKKRTGFLQSQGNRSDPVFPPIGEQPQRIVAGINCRYRLIPVHGSSQEINDTHRDLQVLILTTRSCAGRITVEV
jgi:hypothetical protein